MNEIGDEPDDGSDLSGEERTPDSVRGGARDAARAVKSKPPDRVAADDSDTDGSGTDGCDTDSRDMPESQRVTRIASDEPRSDASPKDALSGLDLSASMSWTMGVTKDALDGGSSSAVELRSWDSSSETSIFDSETRSPETIGRYRVERQLGAGGFGRVYLASDPDLQRRVAIKVPHRQRITSEDDIDRFLDEARTLASLDHPGVVPIYDFDRIEDRYYVVSKFIDGETLGSRLARSPMTVDEIVELMISFTKTLAYIHDSGVIHRDIKPANVLLDQSGNCFVTDFGLALRETSFSNDRGRIGTVAYMSPEQARGEGHLVDSRSDLFSVGIMLYEILSGDLPFNGPNWQAIIKEICESEPKPLRQVDSSIPKELERICNKLMSKRAAARYADASQVADDLSHFRRDGDRRETTRILEGAISSDDFGQGGASTKSSDRLVGIVPRGLRSFDQEDAGYFRVLLPGPRDRDDIPDSIQFWRRRIESNDELQAFRVGVIYGSSGSGKSSFVKAGLLPLLSTRIVTVSLEASGDRTERQLLGGLRSRCPDLPDDLNLVESLAWIRRSHLEASGHKVLVVIDQFEQWLHVHGNDPTAELGVALRQCDGVSLQCLLLVRDDFWTGVSRFAELVEEELSRNRNLAMVELFDQRHARKVLAEYGRGFARLPDNLGKLETPQHQFLDQAVEGLAEDGRIVPVQLVMFAEIMKSRSWDARSLQDLGGTKGVGIRFLEEAFGPGAPAENRMHENAATAILKSMLPDAGTNLKGAMRSEDELQVIAGYEGEPRRLSQVLSILDTALRLITPTAPETEPDRNEIQSNGTRTHRFYQLTHDFLVPAIRQWYQRRQQLTLRGRAAMRLADRAEVWGARPEKRHLPSWPEWIAYSLLTKRSGWDGSQAKMMAAATRTHVLGSVSFLAILFVICASSYSFWRINQAEQSAAQVATSSVSELPAVLDDLDRLKMWNKPYLERLREKHSASSSPGIHARLALLRRDADDENLVRELRDAATECDVPLSLLIRDELAMNPRRDQLVRHWWSIFENPDSGPDGRLRAALHLVSYDPPGGQPSSSLANPGSEQQVKTTRRWLPLRKFFVDALIDQTIRDPSDYVSIVDATRSTSKFLLPEIREIFTHPQPSTERQKASALIRDWWADEPLVILDVFLDSDSIQLADFLLQLDDVRWGDLEPAIINAIKESPLLEQTGPQRQSSANRQANAAAYAIRRGEGEGHWRLLRHRSLPHTRSFLIHRLGELDCDPQFLLDELMVQTLPGIRGGLLLALGSYADEKLSSQVRSSVVRIAQRDFSYSEDPHLHSAAQWLLTRLGETDWLQNTIESLAEHDRESQEKGRRQLWSVNSQGQTFLTIERDEEPFQISANEVTVEQFLSFRPDHRFRAEQVNGQDCPMIQTTWYDAVEYCRWLTTEEGYGESDQCYVAVDDAKIQWELKSDYRKCRGYRLPLTAEWEQACFGTSAARLSFGYDEQYLAQYGWTLRSTRLPAQPVGRKKPLGTGVFGMLGNVSEWCSNRSTDAVDTELRSIRGARMTAAMEDVLSKMRGGGFEPETRFFSIGFRVARSAYDP